MSSVTEQTSAGEVEVMFGVNGWVMVGVGRGERIQEQISSSRELAKLLRGFHLMDDEARTVAERVSRGRPGDFALPSPHGDESPRRGTGLPGWIQVVLLLAVIAFVLWGLDDIASGG